jgi:hypothetical protein
MTTAVNDTSKTQRPQQRVQAGQQVGERWYSEKRLGGLSRFAFAITVLNILGHLFLGFEQSWITPFVALAAAYGTDLVGETVEARVNKRPARHKGSFLNLVKFLLPAHISGLAIGMLLYAAENVAAVAFAVSVAMASKYVFRVAVGTDRDGRLTARHFLNPSNFGITVTLVLFPTVGIAPPYQFSENISGALDWLLPLLVIGTGSLLNLKATGRIPLILAWVAAFAAQAILRAFIDGTPVLAGLMPMTGFAFVLFTFYMITDPATTPARRDGQIAFAVAVAAAYALFMELNIVFGLFYALTLVTAGRGLWLFVTRPRPAPAPAMQMSPAE